MCDGRNVPRKQGREEGRKPKKARQWENEDTPVLRSTFEKSVAGP